MKIPTLTTLLTMATLAGCGDSRPPASMTDSGIEEACSFEEHLTNCRYNLADFPAGFLDDNNAFDGYSVVGSSSHGEKYLADSDILSALKRTYGLAIPNNSSVLDSEVKDFYAQNTILVGTPCNNSLVRQYLEISEAECETFFNPGDAVVASKQWGNGFDSILVSGYDSGGVRAGPELWLMNSLI